MQTDLVGERVTLLPTTAGPGGAELRGTIRAVKNNLTLLVRLDGGALRFYRPDEVLVQSDDVIPPERMT